MICPMANSQMLTSKNPRTGARTFLPRATKMIRMVPSVTTHSSATKTSTGRAEKLNPMRPKSQVTVELLQRARRLAHSENQRGFQVERRAEYSGRCRAPSIRQMEGRRKVKKVVVGEG